MGKRSPREACEPSRSGDLTLFDVASGKTTATWKERHTDSVISLDFSPGRQAARFRCAADKIAHVTEVATGKAGQAFRRPHPLRQRCRLSAPMAVFSPPPAPTAW